MRNNSGFTLIELILVTVIIGLLAGMVVANYGGVLFRSSVRIAQGDIANLTNQVMRYAIENNDSYPKNLADLEPQYVRELKSDPWGNPYQYKPPTNIELGNFVIFSAGPDGIPSTDDDVTSSSELE